MNVLYLTPHVEDYLSDSLFHGMRSLLGSAVVDYPKCERLYTNCTPAIRKTIRGGGFTLYTGLCEDIEVDRTDIEAKIRRGAFDLIIISDIWRLFRWFARMRRWLDPRNTVLCDGADSGQVYPVSGYWWRYPARWFVPSPKQFLYFKREWTQDSVASFPDYCLRRIANWQTKPGANWRRIGFSIPEEKIVRDLPAKTKLFPAHIVDPEVSDKLPNSSVSYAFASENPYYGDLQESRFGITTKRAGWDCLRHYEVAAQGSVLCFRNLNLKPETCAPHGLNSRNCITYNNADALFRKIETISDSDYEDMQAVSLSWIRSNTTTKTAESFLTEVKRSRKN
ncbi:MAG TPA: hypothetical protein VIU12_23545 [Chryseolinea sp.]